SSGALASWQLQGFQPQQTALLSSPPLQWRLRGLVKLSGSSADSLVWHNETTGEAVLWSFTAYAGVQISHFPSAGYPWELYGTLDLDLASQAQLVWRQAGVGGAVGLWGAAGEAFGGSALLPIAPGPNWRLQPDPGD
ncbi:MAG: hypothetical protein JO069_03350, partial [Verrucomicrobia bacterium]|nr:hypothetical protein [Verrucomicrobiota bacterium]